jgi:predicted Zn finger-like uncharacterized protein
MPIITQCPACERKVRVPDELLGKKVRCPGCGDTFTAADTPAAPEPKPEPKPPPSSGIAGLDDLNLELDEAPPPPPKPPPRKEEKPKEKIIKQEAAPEPLRPKPASKAKPKPRDEEEDDGKEPCPYCGKRIKADSVRCKYCGEELEEEEQEEEEYDERPSRRGRKRRRGIRREGLPHRGGLVMSLGIVSVCLILIDGTALCCCGGLSAIIDVVVGGIGLGLGIPAWIMGQRDLAKMGQGLMDERGKGSTQTGWICGIIGTILHGLALLASVALFIFLIIMFGASAVTTPAGGAGGGPSNPFAPPPAPGRKFSVEPGERKLWHYLPAREMSAPMPEPRK